MMEALRTWLLGVILTAFAAGLARQAAPRGREQAMVRMAGGLLLTLALLRPLASLPWTDIALEAGSFPIQAQEQAEAYRKDQQENLSSIIEEKTEAYIWDKASELGIACEVSVAAKAGESGVPLPWSVTVAGPYSADLADWIEKEVAIPAERQIWLEESAWRETKENGS